MQFRAIGAVTQRGGVRCSLHHMASEIRGLVTHIEVAKWQHMQNCAYVKWNHASPNPAPNRLLYRHWGAWRDGTMTLQQHHKQMFQERIQRVSAGGPNTMAQVYIGRAGSATQPPAKRSLMSELQVLPMAALTGAIALFLGQLIAFHLFSADAAIAKNLMVPGGVVVANILIGIALALILGKVFRIDKGIRFLALAGGFVAMIWLNTDLIAAYPDIFAIVFSETYVIDILGLGDQIS